MLTLKQIEDAIRKHGNKSAAARALGVPRRTLRTALAKMLDRAALNNDPKVVLPETGFIVKRNSVTYNAAGEVRSQSVTTTAAPGEKYKIPAGYLLKGESALVDASGKITQRWIKTRENADQLEHLVTELKTAFASFEGMAPLVQAPDAVLDDLLTLYMLPDLHMGMYAWGEECGDDYDVNIATKLASDGITKLVSRSAPSKHAILLIKGDYYHNNDQKNVTPRSGHRLDVDGRWDKVYLAGAELLLVMVNRLLQRHEQVEVVIIPGNHDEDAALTLRVAMMLYYRGHERVTIHSKPGLFWYRLYGNTLLGAVHGHTMKDPRDMALTMAADCPIEWGKARFRQIFTGHIHHERAREVGPVRWESFQTPAQTDAHARGAGYRSGRSFQAITFDVQDGEVGRHRTNISKPAEPIA